MKSKWGFGKGIFKSFDHCAFQRRPGGPRKRLFFSPKNKPQTWPPKSVFFRKIFCLINRKLWKYAILISVPVAFLRRNRKNSDFILLNDKNLQNRISTTKKERYGIVESEKSENVCYSPRGFWRPQIFEQGSKWARK